MLAEERRHKILELIREDGSARVSDLSRTFSVTEPTIRSDLERLEREGFVVRDHGGAYLRGVDSLVRSHTLQHRENPELKAAIGMKAREYVDDGDTLILDSGSTVTALAENLTSKRSLHVVTNALNIALILGVEPSMTIHMTGGEFKAPTLSLTGEQAAQSFAHIHVKKLFLATAGVSWDAGLTYPGFSDLPVKRAMIEAAETVYLLADSTKIGKTAFASLGMLSSVDCLITDDGINGESVYRLEAMGIEVVTTAV